MKKDVQSRKWQLTINEPLKKGYTHEKIKEQLKKLTTITYYCMSDEIAAKHHTHVYIYSPYPIRFSTIKKNFDKFHIEKAYGNTIDNIAYIFKTGKWENTQKKETNLEETHEEWGEPPQERQGARNDITELYELIESECSTYEILEYNPEYLTQIDRIEKVRQVFLEEKYKNVFRNLKVTYIYGDTGAGKTRSVMEKYGYSNVYRITSYRNGFDQYKGQDVICFEEFDSSLPIREMLLYLDGYPVMLPCRYADKVACYTQVYILSNIDLKNQYLQEQHLNPETWHAFLRRIHNIEVFKNGKVESFTTAEYMDSFRILSKEELKNIPFKAI